MSSLVIGLHEISGAADYKYENVRLNSSLDLGNAVPSTLEYEGSRGGSRNSSRGGGGVLGRNSSGGGLGSRSTGIFIY